MYGLLVGGYLPGTNIQLSFQAWLAFSALLWGVVGIYRLERKARASWQRVPFPANYVHVRLRTAR